MLFTSVTPETVAVALGVPAPSPSGNVEPQWQMWIDDSLMLIQDRTTALEVDEDTIGQAKLDYVIRESVVAQVKKPDDSTQVTIAIDDGSTSKSYKSSTGRVTILEEWWVMLGLNPRSGRAFEVDTMPSSAGVYGVDYWWSTPTTSVDIP